MQIDRRLFRSRLAHRVFLAFVLCALVPLLIVGVVSYRSVSDQLVTQASLRLRSASKGLGLSLYERLLFADAEFLTIADTVLSDPPLGHGEPRAIRFSELSIVERDRAMAMVEDGWAEGSFEHRQRDAHLGRGGSVLLPLTTGSDPMPVILAKRLDPEDPGSDLVAGEVDAAYLWGLVSGNSVPAGSEFCVFSQGGRLIYGSFSGCADAWRAFGGDFSARDETEIRAVFKVANEDDDVFIAGQWDLFLGARFFSQDWMVVVCEPRSSVVQPIERWRVVFPAVVTLVFWVVLLLIISAIRKNLDPIDRLREATVHLADRDFDFKVDVKTGDELEQLADAFNEMSVRLRRQFGALAATGKIHRAILSSFETVQVVDETALGVFNFFDCDRASIIVVDPSAAGVGRTTIVRGHSVPVFDGGQTLNENLRSELERVQQGLVLGHDLPMSPALETLLDMGGMETTLAVPIIARGRIVAAVGLGFEGRRELPEDDLDQLTQLADQFAVAHANATMLQEVNDFSLGTLEALARAVDAKSPWTAGHSERVTYLAVAIGEAYGLDPAEITKLHRGAMLHDIGKLGISQTLLDKRGRLSTDEYNMVRSHTMIGERILEPIESFADIMPIVSQHHERFDGSGYHCGLSGSGIDLKARILAVADVYDAMTNPRPYRDSVDPKEVVEMIRKQSGSQFDPDVVSAFLTVIDDSGGVEDLAMLKRNYSFFSWHGEASKQVWDEHEKERGR